MLKRSIWSIVDEAGGVRATAAWLEQCVVLSAAAVTFAFELVLAERKYGLFSGGFGQSHDLTGVKDVLTFLLLTGAAQLLIVGAIYVALFNLMTHRSHQFTRLFMFVTVAIGLNVVIVTVKFQILQYFSDAVSFQLLTSLGGGSVLDAALFALSEAALILATLGTGTLLFVAGLLLVRRMSRSRPSFAQLPAIGLKGLLIAAACMPVATIAANRDPNVRHCADRMMAYGLIRRGLNLLSDFDNDGYGLLSMPADDAPFDATRHPLALDVPGNGIDEDGLAGDLRAPPATSENAGYTPPSQPRNLVLLVLESTRGDVLGKRVNGRPIAPNLEALARRGSSAPHAYSHVGFTTHSLKAMLTGNLIPRSNAPSLFRDLKRAGYRIGVFSGQPEDFGDISATTGMRASSDVYFDAETLKADRAFGFAAKGSLLVDEGKLLAAFDRTIGAVRWTRPTFLYLNFQSAHFPYHHPGMLNLIEPKPLPRGEIAPENRARLERTYFNAVAYSDRMLGEVVARLKSLGVWRDTLLVVTADHGESLFDDGFLGHGHVVSPEQTRVPLVLSQPGVSLHGSIGLRDYRGLLLDLLSKRDPRRRPNRVLHYIGDIDAPSHIGITEKGGVQTVLNLETREVTFRDLRAYSHYDRLTIGSVLRARADNLIQEWGHQRWFARNGSSVLKTSRRRHEGRGR